MSFISSMAIINKNTEIGERGGIPLCKMWEFDVTLFIKTLKDRFIMKALIRLKSLGPMPQRSSLQSTAWILTQSRALSKSVAKIETGFLVEIAFDAKCLIRNNASIVLWFFLEASRLWEIRLWRLMNQRSLYVIIFSRVSVFYYIFYLIIFIRLNLTC